MYIRILFLVWLGLLLQAPYPVLAAEQPAYISIIIDDLGDQWRSGERSLQLPGAITYSILPHTPYSRRIAELAYENGREVMLHLPMASVHARYPGPGTVDTSMDREAFLHQVAADLAAVPHISGVNNHMGSQVTPSTRHMDWLMEDLHTQGGLFFIDSMTTVDSVAAVLAREKGVPVMKRDVFLDHDRSPEQVQRQFERLIKLAQRRGWAVAIGHPYPETLSLLEQELPKLEARGIKLLPVSQLIAAHTQQVPIVWQASLSPSPQDLKN